MVALAGHGADVQAAHADGWTAIMIAAQNGHHATVEAAAAGCGATWAEPSPYAPPGDDFKIFEHLDDAGTEGWSAPSPE